MTGLTSDPAARFSFGKNSRKDALASALTGAGPARG
jgi:hypothetical protein